MVDGGEMQGNSGVGSLVLGPGTGQKLMKYIFVHKVSV